MGDYESVPPSIPPPVFLNEPWRQTEGWGESVRSELKDHVASLAPQTRGQLDVPYFNIALTGEINAGKSSFLNSLNSIYQERVIGGKAETGTTAQSLTQEFRKYEIRSWSDSDPLPWKIFDTMGLEPSLDVEYDVTNILKAVDGHVPDRFQFPKQEIIQDTPGFIPSPRLKDKAHCVAVVIDGESFQQMQDDMKRKLRNLRKGLITRNIPAYILLTHIDEACPEVVNDVKNVYRSTAIRDLVHKVSKILHGLPKNQIFPVMNYKEHIELDDNMDILLLYAIRQMLYSAQARLENQIGNSSN